MLDIAEKRPQEYPEPKGEGAQTAENAPKKRPGSGFLLNSGSLRGV
jgi:hypothetical protein